jgi:uncharacterized membrane protein
MPDLYEDTGFSEFNSPDITAWRLARAAIEHENALVNHRLTWFLTSQAFLFSAFVLVFLAWSKGEVNKFDALVPYILVVLGIFAIYICAVIHVGLKRAFIATDKFTKHYKDLRKRNNFGSRTPPLHFWSKPRFINQQFLPLATILVWTVLVAVCALYNIPAMQTVINRFGINEALWTLLVVAAFGIGIFLSPRILRGGNQTGSGETGFDEDSD